MASAASGEQSGHGQPSSRQPKRSYLRQLKVCDRLFTWATDQPRHATQRFDNPVEPSSPPERCSILLGARAVEKQANPLSRYRLPSVTPGQLSVRKGVQGSPALSKRLHTGLSAQA